MNISLTPAFSRLGEGVKYIPSPLQERVRVR